MGNAWQEILARNLKLKLGAVLVGSNPEFKKFVEMKGKVAEKIGVGFQMYQFPENITTEALKEEVRKISSENDGVLVELPLPGLIDSQAVLNEIPLKKDVDVLSEEAQGLFYNSQSEIFPPAVEAVKVVLEEYKVDPIDKKVAVFGQGLLVGKPISYWFDRMKSEVYRIDEFTESPEQYSVKADIVVSGVGKPYFITGDMIKDGAVILDFGYENKEGKMVGDIEMDSAGSKASLITPVPGGMGPIVVASVLKNLVKLNS